MDTEKFYKLIKHPSAPLVTFILGMIMGGLLFCAKAEAGGRYYYQPPTQVTNNLVSSDSNGIALAIATAQHHFDFGTHSWQGSIGVGNFNSDSAISFGVAKRMNRVLVNASFGHEHDNTGVGVGVNWRF